MSKSSPETNPQNTNADNSSEFKNRGYFEAEAQRKAQLEEIIEKLNKKNGR